MTRSDHFLPLYDDKGNLHSVTLSAELWKRGNQRLAPIINLLLEAMEPTPPSQRPEPLADWETFKEYWDFQYPYNAEVECKHCGSRTDDWTTDPAKPFRLKSAQLGGLAVFGCAKCGATVRKKHFKDHVCFEYTVSGECSR